MQRCEDNVAARLNGNALQPLSEVSVTVTDDKTGLPATLFSDNGVTQVFQPLKTDDNGYYGFYAANGEYTLTFSGIRIATFERKIVLQDPDDNPYATKAELAAGSGATLISHNGRALSDKLGEFVSVKDAPFNAKGDGVTDDTAAIQAAIDATKAGSSLRFPPGSYKVSTLTTGRCETVWYFDKAELVAGATVPTDCILKFGGVHTRIYGMRLNGNFKTNYTCLLWWYNDTDSSQHNDFFGLELRYAKRGIVYGAMPGSTSTGFAQSENSVFGLHARGVEKPLCMNHQNGLLFMSASHLVAHNEEWASFAPGQFSNTGNFAFESLAGVLTVEGSEIQNSIAATTSYCAKIDGGEVHLNGCISEVDAPFYVSGKLYIDGGKVFNTQSETSQFYIPPTALAATKLHVSDAELTRNLGVGSYSGNKLISNAGAPVVDIRFDNCNLTEWAKFVPLAAANNEGVQFRGVRWRPNGNDPAEFRLDTHGASLIDRPGIDTQGYTADGFYQHVWYGGGTTFNLSTDVPAGSHFANSLAVNATGQAGYFTADPTSLATLKQTAIRVKQGDRFDIECWIRFVAGGGGQAGGAIVMFDAAGAVLGTPYLRAFDQDQFVTSSWKLLRNVLEIPAGVAYVGFGAQGITTEVRFCGLKVRRANWSS